MKISNLLRTIRRGVLVILHLLFGIAATGLMRLRMGKHWYATRYGQHLAQWWMQYMARLCGICINQYGSPPAHPALFVANHISFIDIIVVSATTETIFLSKNSVRYWPLVGWLSSLGGVIYIKRGKRNMIARIIDSIGEGLKEGRSIMVFPEGTTGYGLEPMKFHAGLFQAAINTDTKVQAIALRYCDTPENCSSGKLDRTAAYIENDNLLVTLYRIIRRPRTIVHVKYCPTIESHEHNRNDLAKHCRQQVIDALAEDYVANH